MAEELGENKVSKNILITNEQSKKREIDLIADSLGRIRFVIEKIEPPKK